MNIRDYLKAQGIKVKRSEQWGRYHYNQGQDSILNIKIKVEIYKHLGGEDDGYGGKTSPITWKEAYKEVVAYESWAKKEMKKACDKIKAHAEWKYGKDAYPSSYERAIVAGCSQAVKELQESKPSREKVRKVLEKYFGKEYLRDIHTGDSIDMTSEIELTLDTIFGKEK